MKPDLDTMSFGARKLSSWHNYNEELCSPAHQRTKKKGWDLTESHLVKFQPFTCEKKKNARENFCCSEYLSLLEVAFPFHLFFFSFLGYTNAQEAHTEKLYKVAATESELCCSIYTAIEPKPTLPSLIEKKSKQIRWS